MPNKKNNEKDKQESTSSLGELDQLRKIVFGDAQQQLIAKLTKLRSDTEQAQDTQDKKFSLCIDKMQRDFIYKLEELDKRINAVDKMHDDNEADIQKNHENLTCEHEMFAAATREDFKNIDQSLHNESDTLSKTFNDQLEQLKKHLEDVSKDLRFSKTDRKTLAQLLATMAINLEDDQR
ncbi:hypothetical protein HQQ94_13400 [Shewanella sp. VB17]|uniref:hypothetical protein n=1 Tax=Shewanella sp. VB17 TaxID=2739432 RepID=UPI001566A355|nr:hypothetical protein [Shewanella sp. VB17]NRD74213.1 hypothetical protein [Shewanella sp. VB17]